MDKEDKCLDLPNALKLLDTQISSLGFRDFGAGELGFVIKGSVNLTAQHVTYLITLLADEGVLDE